MNVVFAIDERNHKVHTSKVDKPGAERKSDEGIRQQIRFCEQMENSMDDIKRFPNKRNKTKDADNGAGFVFQSELKENPTYDAFEQDIGIINIFFAKPRILRYVTTNRMSNFDFLSQLGGSVGLAMGISIISFVELVYWFSFRLMRNFRKGGVKPLD